VRVKVGESFVAETEDAYERLIRKPGDAPIPEHILRTKPGYPVFWGNPLTGPIYVEGAMKGDVLAVNIEKIIVDEQGVAGIEHGVGPLHDSTRWPECTGTYSRIIKHLPGLSGTTRDGKAVFSDKITWDLKPFIGTIGVAPLLEVSSSVTGQGTFGGNIDCRDIKEGTTLYLNCYNDGGLLYLGDVHGTQADTELTGVADETRAEVTLRCHVIKNKQVSNPRLEKKDSIITLGSSASLQHSVTTAIPKRYFVS
jgi:acetamidase/formamidase